MKRIKIDSIKDIIINDMNEVQSFIGYTTIKHNDINNNTYELKDDEEKYCLLKKIRWQFYILI